MSNRIPKSLERPFLRDAFVEFSFTPLVSPVLLPGIFYERLRGDWKTPGTGLHSLAALGLQINSGSDEVPVFTNAGYRLYISESSIYFNVDDEYFGWSKSYFPLLQNIVPDLLDKKTVIPTRVGLRFINDLETEDVFKLTNRFDSESLTGFNTTGQTVQWSLKRDDVRATLNVSNNVRTVNNETFISVVDIDLQQPLPEQSRNVEEALTLVDGLHRFNKEIIFGELLPESFVSKFGPSY